MKKIILFFCSSLLCIHLFAQDFPSYGIVSDQDIKLKQCDFDKDANAAILLHEASSDYDDQHQLITYHHLRIKILKEKGIEHGNVTIPFYRKDNFESIDEVEGMTINVTENLQVNTTKLERKSIFTQKINERIGQVAFAFPEIHVGSIIDYKYRSIMKHYGGLEDWYFQDRLPVVVSRYTLIIVPNAEFAYRVNKTVEIPITVKPQARGGVFFEMNNIPGLGNEPYMDARRDYLQKVIFQLSKYGSYGYQKKYMTSWDELGRELLMASEFGSQLNKSIPGTDDFIKLAKLLLTPEDKMKAVFNFVRNNMSWNDLDGVYSSDGVKNAWQKKNGTRADINLVLVNLLKEAGLEAYPMLVSERLHGKVSAEYPFIDQFNTVFACVAIQNRKYYLDAADKSSPPHITPFNILNTTAYIVNRKAGGLINITNDTLQYKEYILATLTLDEKGLVTGDVSVKSYDYARLKKLEDFHTVEKEKFIDKYFTVNETTIRGKELALQNEQQDSLPLEQTCKITGSLNSTGDYFYFPLNLFCGFDFNPFLSDYRFSNINFGYRKTILLNATINLPANYAIDELPKSMRLSNPDKDLIFIRQMEYDKEANSIRCSMQFEFKKSLYENDMYPVVKEMYKKLFEYLKEPLVLKKKP